jgi:SpoVG protein
VGGYAMNIRVEEIRKLERGLIRGFATVTIGGIRISHIKIVHAEGKELFIEMPQRSYQMTNGERRYSNIVDLPDDLQRKLEKAILRFWNPQRYAWPNADQDTQAA